MFIEILEKELKSRKLSMNKLAKETGIKQSTLAAWKKGTQPSIDKITIICKHLNISADELLELKPKPPNEITETEKQLIEYYRKSDQRGKDYIIETAEREATRGNPNETLSNLDVS